MNKPRFLSLIFLFPIFLYGQTFNNELYSLVDSIAAYNRLDGAYIGYGAIQSNQFARFGRLMNIATSRDLLLLTNHPNPTVKCASYQALCIKDSVDVIPILIEHLYDTSFVSTQQGCIGSYEMTGDYFLQTFYSYLVTKDSLYFVANNNRLYEIDSILFYDPEIKLAYKSAMIKSVNGDSLYYDRVREIAENERLPESVIALAKFKKQQDKLIIASYFNDNKLQYYAIWAVREFPDSSFYPLLINVFNKEWNNKYYDYPKWRILYQALAQYPNAQTLEIFEKTINARNKFRRETLGRYLLIAITKYPNPIFEQYKTHISIDNLHGTFLNQVADVEK